MSFWRTLCVLAIGLSGPASAQEDDSAVKMLERTETSLVKIYGAGGFTGIPAYGTGVLVDERGFVLTAWSIALRTDQLKVVVHDGRRYPAELWRADPRLGVALIKIKGPGAGFRSLRLGDSRQLQPGDTVYAVGNSFGFVFGDERLSVLRGVVSAIDSPRRGGVNVTRLPEGLDEVILTDVPNNPGSQGGPLLTQGGDMVGLLGRIVESRATNTILNYAVPTAALRDFLRKGTAAERAQVGLPRGQGRPAQGSHVETGLRLLREHLARPPVAYVERVAEGSPADKAGIQPDDLIFRAAGRTIRNCRDFDEVLAERQPGERLSLIVKRGEAMLKVELVLGEAQ